MLAPAFDNQIQRGDKKRFSTVDMIMLPNPVAPTE